MYPGLTTVTVTPLGPSSALRESKYPCRACLEAESRTEGDEREKRGGREGEEREKRGRREVLAVLAPNSCLMHDKHSSLGKKRLHASPSYSLCRKSASPVMLMKEVRDMRTKSCDCHFLAIPLNLTSAVALWRWLP